MILFHLSPFPFLCLIFLLVFPFGLAKDVNRQVDFLMPGVEVAKADQYICASFALNKTTENYLVGFTPHASMKTAHHMLLFSCLEPGSTKAYWNCGEMTGGGDQKSYPVCASGTSAIYAWAMDATELQLPEGVGFVIGGQTTTQFLVLQLHYMHPLSKPDTTTGLTLHFATQKVAHRAGTLLLGTDGRIRAKTTENCEVACKIQQNIVMHPFAFRTHTHKFGRVVSGWRVQRDENGQDHWTLIGKQNPQLPQMFYPVENHNLTVKMGDTVAARCTMKNDLSKDVKMGATGEDEMCNFYMMYWVEGNDIYKANCFSLGPPLYYWTKDGLNNIPDKEASTIPKDKEQADHHQHHHHKRCCCHHHHDEEHEKKHEHER